MMPDQHKETKTEVFISIVLLAFELFRFIAISIFFFTPLLIFPVAIIWFALTLNYFVGLLGVVAALSFPLYFFRLHRFWMRWAHPIQHSIDMDLRRSEDLILFLRSFDADRAIRLTAYLNKSSRLPKWLNAFYAGLPYESLYFEEYVHELIEEQQVPDEQYKKKARALAIGKKDRAGPPKYATSDKEWQEVVEDIAQRARAIILIPSNSIGLEWEIEHISKKYWYKTVLLWPPKDGVEFVSSTHLYKTKYEKKGIIYQSPLLADMLNIEEIMKSKCGVVIANKMDLDDTKQYWQFKEIMALELSGMAMREALKLATTNDYFVKNMKSQKP